jgi:uncharacterized protein (DUF1697 family)
VDAYISMLRGINVSGQRKVNMQELRRLYASLGFEGVQTYIQSGNVIFRCPLTDPRRLTETIESEIRRSFGLEVKVFVRTSAEFRELVGNNPFAGRDESKLHVTFLSGQPARVPLGEMRDARSGAEDFLISGQSVYLFCPDGYGGTELSNGFFERKLKVAATTRNWKTVNSLLSIALASQSS